MKSTGGGEIVQVHGGHILRSTGRKDRHSKVCTTKGPRDRRVRLSAHTAIQFYDVQDRLGYDRPSKAVDWLINKAKTAIDKLAKLPPWDPTNSESNNNPIEEKQSQSDSGFGYELHSQLGSSFLSQSIEPESISETMKSFFPISSQTHQSMDFQRYPHGIQSEDLCLSLQSLQDPNSNNTYSTDHHHQPLFSGSLMNFEANYPKMMAWNGGGDDTESRDRYIYNSITMPQQSMNFHSSSFSQREPLQSSFTNSYRAWDDHGIVSTENQDLNLVHQSSISRTQFGSEGTSRFRVPARIHGEEELGLVSDKSCSASPNSLH